MALHDDGRAADRLPPGFAFALIARYGWMIRGFEMVMRRIEAAMARLEALAQQPRADAAAQLAEVEASNARLREAVGLSLRQIDALIARHGGEQQP